MFLQCDNNFLFLLNIQNVQKLGISGLKPHFLSLNESQLLISSNIVYITGELNNYEGRGISAPYFSSKRANYYINNFAGGYSKQNDRFNTTVTYPNGSVKKSINFGMFALSPKVTEGSVINLKNITEKPNKSMIPIDWNAAIENTMIKVTGVLSLYLLVDRIRGSY